jgi:predicted transposase YdaD
LPLAVLGRLPEGRSIEEGLAGVVAAIDRRLWRGTDPAEARRLLTASFVLSGLRVPQEIGQRVFRGAIAMRESTTYQAILDEGRAEGRADGIQRALFIQGRKRFGVPDLAVQNAVREITDLARLERMSERLLDVSTWQDLLATS